MYEVARADSLRDGLTAGSAVKAAPALRQLLGTPAVAIADQTSIARYTVQAHLKSIVDKLAFHSRLALLTKLFAPTA